MKRQQASRVQSSPVVPPICEYHFGVMRPARAGFLVTHYAFDTKVTPFSGIPISAQLTSNKTKC
jgi:hypothetical protein